MPFSHFRKVHVEDLSAGDRIWFADAIVRVVSVVPEEDPMFRGCFRIYTEKPTTSGRDYIYTFPDHEFLAPWPGQSDEAFIRDVVRALEIIAEREAAKAPVTGENSVSDLDRDDTSGV